MLGVLQRRTHKMSALVKKRCRRYDTSWLVRLRAPVLHKQGRRWNREGIMWLLRQHQRHYFKKTLTVEAEHHWGTLPQFRQELVLSCCKSTHRLYGDTAQIYTRSGPSLVQAWPRMCRRTSYAVQFRRCRDCNCALNSAPLLFFFWSHCLEIQ